MIHPLTGADPITLVRLFARAGLPAATHWPSLAGALLSGTARAPFSLTERAYVALRRPERRMPAPIFILGHWRSGTTHLFNLLSGAPDLTYASPIPTGLPWDFLLLGRLLKPLLTRAIPSQRGIDPMAVTPDAPQEDEIGLAGMGVPSYYHGVYCPQVFRREMARGLFLDGCTVRERAGWQRALRQFTAKVSESGGGRRVLIKNPAHTAKVSEIRRIWPNARFVHIVRNPYYVYHSTTRMFDDLLEMLALQSVDREAVTAAIQESYPRMMGEFESATEDLTEPYRVNVRFEDLEQNPVGEVGRIARALELDNPDAVVAAAENHMRDVAGYASRTREIPSEVATAVDTYWDAERTRLGYPRAGDHPSAEKPWP